MRSLLVPALLLIASSARADDAPSLDAVGGGGRPPSPDWRAPQLADWTPRIRVQRPSPLTEPPAGWTHLARPTGFRVPVYDRVEKPRALIARTRRGEVFPARTAESTASCYDNGTTGRWWSVPGGVVCSSSGYEFGRRLEPFDEPQRPPAVNRALPFRFGRVIVKGAPRFSQRPTPAEVRWALDLSPEDQEAESPAAVIERMWDDFFLALSSRELIADTPVVRTVYGEYVLADHLKILQPPPMQGEFIDAEAPLPVAFVRGEDNADLWCERGGRLERCGEAEKHARFRPKGVVSRQGEAYLRGWDGRMIAAERVRVARPISRPAGVQPGEKWIHVNLGEQTLVAYEGDQPIFATLVSSGKPGHDTPTGLYQVQRKYLSKTMRGRDPKEGIYHVEEVPWTTYYHGAYAIHGAYWHNTFGDVRSHGCTNVAPADARFIYLWGEPEMAPHLHAQVNESAMHFYFTQD
ncbi:MAG: L,D-transpeptidase [Myxococcota bacterium]